MPRSLPQRRRSLCGHRRRERKPPAALPKGPASHDRRDRHHRVARRGCGPKPSPSAGLARTTRDVSNDALFSFVQGHTTLTPDVLKKLAGLFAMERPSDAETRTAVTVGHGAAAPGRRDHRVRFGPLGNPPPSFVRSSVKFERPTRGPQPVKAEAAKPTTPPH